jgi:cyclophilin family peptidyl-prolyl cis-trans isomerase
MGDSKVKQLLLVLYVLVGLVVGELVTAQVDEVVYNQTAKRLSYVMDYDRILENAEARDCSQDAFENSFLHTALRNLFLYLPYEASFYPDVETLEVRALSGDTLVLYAVTPLAGIRETNARFRIFMNGFASSRAGFCFTVEGGVLESWISTLVARGGRVALDTEVFASRLEGLQDLAGLEVAALENTQGAAEPAPEPVAQEPASQEPAPVAQAEPVPQAEPTSAPRAVVQTVNGYSVVPYLSAERILNFSSAQQVLKANIDYAAVIETTQGTMTIDLFEQQAPLTVNNFVFLALNQYYEGVSLFRVIDEFIAQTGDPTGTGVGTAGYQFADEISPGFSHSTAGILSTANSGPNTNSSQFFITLAPLPALDGAYTIFGAVIDGLDVLDRLTRTDPTRPLAVASLESTVGLLETQGISLGGNDRETLQGLITRTLGALPEPAQRFSIGNYDAILGNDGTSELLSLAFWPKSDVVKHVYIVEKAR